MQTSTWKIKDVAFGVDERKKASVFVFKMIQKDWELFDGRIEDGLVFGEKDEENPNIEKIQLNNSLIRDVRNFE